MRHVVMFSGGIGSWAAAKRVVERHGTDSLVLLFTDTLCEDEDTYRFLREAAENVGGELVWLKDGRTIWDVFRESRFLGNSRVAPCSHALKQNVANRWLADNCDPADTVVYVGIDWTEEHRYVRLREIRAAQGWRYEAPLCEPPYLTKDQMHEWAEREGLRKQRLYLMGAPHANCGGGCVKMGIGGFVRLYHADPCRFAEWEANEESLRQHLGRDDVAILRDRTGGETRPMTLRELRGRLEAGGQVDMFDVGGCGCFVDVDDDDAPVRAARRGEAPGDGPVGAVCANCGDPNAKIAGGELDPDEAVCSVECYEQLRELGCPQEHGGTYRPKPARRGEEERDGSLPLDHEAGLHGDVRRLRLVAAQPQRAWPRRAPPRRHGPHGSRRGVAHGRLREA